LKPSGSNAQKARDEMQDVLVRWTAKGARIAEGVDYRPSLSRIRARAYRRF
jgi:hypothetical protein